MSLLIGNFTGGLKRLSSNIRSMFSGKLLGDGPKRDEETKPSQTYFNDAMYKHQPKQNQDYLFGKNQ
jgi:hypothetical protein